MSSIRRDFLPGDLLPEIETAGIDGTILVQARQTLEETDWILSLADRHSFIQGVVGWVPLADSHVERDLERFAAHPKLKGVRHVLHDEPDDFYMLRSDFNAGIRLLPKFDLVYDLLIFERHLPQAIEFVDRHPQTTFVIDHVAKPRIREHALSPWRENIMEISRRENVFCKVSGMLTEAHCRNWKPEELQPYFAIVLEAFGPKRLMFGSDWPVLLVAGSYADWVNLVGEAISALSSSEQEWVMGRTATQVYRLHTAA